MKALLRLKKKIENQNGFTLVEIIVTLAIFSIVLVVAGNYLFFGNNLYAKTEVKNMEKYIGDNVFEYMQRRLTYATELEVINPAKPSEEPKYSKIFKLNADKQFVTCDYIKGEGESQKGSFTDETNIFGSDFYNNRYKVSYEVTVLDANHVKLKVNVLPNGENTTAVYSTEEVLKLINLRANSKDLGAILMTNGERNTTYTDPMLSYNEEKKISTTYDPLVLREQMLETYRQVALKQMPEDYDKIVGTSNLYVSNDNISSYVAQYYYGNGISYLNTWDKVAVYQYWPDFPGVDSTILEKVDAKIVGEGYENQTLSAYLDKYKDSMKMRAYLISDDKGNVSCFVYVSNASNVQWQTRLVYCDVQGQVGWYYLEHLKGDKKGQLSDQVDVSDRQWRQEDGVSSSKAKKMALYDEIMDTGGKGLGVWIKVE